MYEPPINFFLNRGSKPKPQKRSRVKKKTKLKVRKWKGPEPQTKQDLCDLEDLSESEWDELLQLIETDAWDELMEHPAHQKLLDQLTGEEG